MDWRFALAMLGLAGFLWLIVAALRGAWQQEQDYQAQESAWQVAHPAPPADWRHGVLSLAGLIVGLAAVVALVTLAQMNVAAACMLVAAPVLITRRIRRYRREREAANAGKFGEYVPSFKERR